MVPMIRDARMMKEKIMAMRILLVFRALDDCCCCCDWCSSRLTLLEAMKESSTESMAGILSFGEITDQL